MDDLLLYLHRADLILLFCSNRTKDLNYLAVLLGTKLPGDGAVVSSLNSRFTKPCKGNVSFCPYFIRKFMNVEGVASLLVVE